MISRHELIACVLIGLILAFTDQAMAESASSAVDQSVASNWLARD